MFQLIRTSFKMNLIYKLLKIMTRMENSFTAGLTIIRSQLAYTGISERMEKS